MMAPNSRYLHHLYDNIYLPLISIYPESASQLSVWQLGGQLEVFKADPLPGPLVPGKQHSQLEGGHLQVILAHLVLKGYLEKLYFV